MPEAKLDKIIVDPSVILSWTLPTCPSLQPQESAGGLKTHPMKIVQCVTWFAPWRRWDYDVQGYDDRSGDKDIET